jgi:predicted metal-dependent peptidase
MKSVSKLDKAKAQIVLDHPFFSSILLRKQLIEDSSIQTLAVNPRGDIFYNPEFIDSLPVPQIVWGLCHEIGHVIGQHATRRRHREHRKWNYAGDAWINDMLNECNVGEPIPNTVNMPGSKDKTTEQIYEELPDDNGGGGSTGSGSSGSGANNPQDSSQFANGLGDDIIEDPNMTEDQIKEIEAQAKVEIAQAAQAAKARGKLPGKLAEIVLDIIDVKTPWFEHLERYMTSHTKQNYTWTRPNRRFIGQGMYLPSMDKQPSMGEVVLQVDVSGSITQTELSYYNGHVARIMAQCMPEKVHVLYVDTKVRKHDVFELGEEIKLTYHSGGGTDMTAGFDYIYEQGIEAQVVVTLTDGYTPFPETTDIPSVWCISSDTKSPIGETIHFQLNN